MATIPAILSNTCRYYGITREELTGGVHGPAAARGAVVARRSAAKSMRKAGHTLTNIAGVLGYSGPSPVRYLLTGKR